MFLLYLFHLIHSCLLAHYLVSLFSSACPWSFCLLTRENFATFLAYVFITNMVAKVFCPKNRLSKIFTITVWNFQSMKSPVELNSLLLKFFCYITWLVISPDQTRHWKKTWKRDLYVKFCCTFKTIDQQFKNYELITEKSVLLCEPTSCKQSQISDKLQVV